MSGPAAKVDVPREESKEEAADVADDCDDKDKKEAADVADDCDDKDKVMNSPRTPVGTGPLSLDDADNVETIEVQAFKDDEKEVGKRVPGEKLVTIKRAARLSKVLKTMMDGEKEAKLLPLPQVNLPELKLMLEYWEHEYKNPSKPIEKPLVSNNLADATNAWNAQFMDQVAASNEGMSNFLVCVLALDIKPLEDLACAKIACMIKGKTAEEIRKQFNIINDFTPEEEEAIINENKWSETPAPASASAPPSTSSTLVEPE